MLKKLTVLAASTILCLGLCIVSVSAYDTATAGKYQTVSMGGSHTAVIKPDGSLWTWGANYDGQLGNGGKTDAANDRGQAYQDSPVKVLDDVVSVSCGDYHTVALKSDGSVWAWGNNDHGQIGNGGTGDQVVSGHAFQTTPVKIMDQAAAICCGKEATAVIKADGSLWVWGYAENTGNILSPKKIIDSVLAFSFSGGYNNTVLMSDHSLWYWGSIDRPMYQATVGKYYIGDYCSVGSRFKISDNVLNMSCGSNWVTFVKNDGSVWTWGDYNHYGHYGTGILEKYTPEKFVPRTKELASVQVPGLHDIISVSCGGGFGFVGAVQSDGTLWLWGSNFDGQIGNGFSGIQRPGESMVHLVQPSPQRIMTGVAFVNCGPGGSTAAVRRDGSLWTWGDNSFGKLGYQGGDNQYSVGSSIGNSGLWWAKFTPQQVAGFVLQQSDSSISGVLPDTGFYDVFPDAYYANAVDWAVRNGVTSGTAKGQFSPNKNCTVMEIVTFLWRAYGSPASSSYCPVSSWTPDNPFYAPACWMNEKDLLGENLMVYMSDCTRAMAMTYLWKAAGCPVPSRNITFSDVPANASYAQAVAWAVEKGITSGTSATTFSPDTTCTRAQIITFLYRNLG